MGNECVKYKFTWKKCWIHLKTIIKHKHYVFHYCCKCGIPWQGIVHDLSKFSPSEFFTNVKYAREGKSPIDVQKEEIGYSFPWQHHKGRNPHHYEFWMDKFDNGCYVHRMPYKYTVEMLCDNLGAGKAYSNGKATYTSEMDWWIKQREIRNMHPDNTRFLDIVFGVLYYTENKKLHPSSLIPWRFIRNDYHNEYYCGKESDVLNKKMLKKIYRYVTTEENNREECVKIRQPE